MTLTLYNTLTRQKEAFQPLVPGQVKLYCCGMTVYDYCHLGHARTCLVWDVARRYLQWLGYEVEYIQNFTDIDDKILNRAKAEGRSMEVVSEKFIAAYFEDMERLHIGKADAYPRATHALDGIKRLVAELEQKGAAYAAGGDVYYSVRKFADYGKLSGRKLDDLQAGASGRVKDGEEAKKQDAFDFALWKGAKPGEPAWDSPWGQGRPGWHIECSAMVLDRFGSTIDIHVGGADLIFPHHENEIAQSEAATGQPLSHYWLHNGMVMVDGEKMSKSLGNFTTIRELLDRHVDPMAIRLFVLQTQYRKPVDFTQEAIASATNGWQTLKESLLFGYEYGDRLDWQAHKLPSGNLVQKPLDNSYTQEFAAAVNEDFNFAGGLVVLFELAKELRRDRNLMIHEGKTATEPKKLEELWQTLVNLAHVFGFTVSLADLELETEQPSQDTLSDAQIDLAISQRQAARQARNFGESDRIRQELQAQGVILIDSPDGSTRWHRV
jgi:cysteinyl-tRNA synthetase